MTSYGTDLTATVVTNQQKQSISVSNNYQLNGTAVEIVTVDYGDQSLLPAINSPHPTLTGYVLTSIEGEEIAGSLFKATCTYTNYFQSLPATTYVEQTSQQEVAIQEHPSFPTWVTNGWWDSTNNQFLASSPLYGISSYIVGSTTVVKTEYFSSQPADQFANVGTLQAPNSAYGSYENWLVVGSTKRQANANWVRETTFLYSANPWNSNIYSEAS